MSESSKNNGKTLFQRIAWLIIMIAVIIIMFGLGYASGYFLLPGMVRSAYQSKDCDTVLSRNDIYTRLYPSILVDNEVIDLVRECAIYTWAIRNEKMENWRDSYIAFHVYSDTYPQGLFVAEAHENEANALINLVREEMTAGKYSDAIVDIDSLLEDYADTAVAADAEKLRFDLHLSFGVELRDNGDFVGAEKVFTDIYAWAHEKDNMGYSTLSRLELAKTYLEWGIALQSQENFTEAKMKYDIAVSSDPDPSSDNGPAEKARTNEVDLYTQWGDSLVQQGNYIGAMAYYGIAAELAEKLDPVSAENIMVKAYVNWAMRLSENEDFIGALVLLDYAETNFASEPTKEIVDGARQNVYLAFSKSDGEQALNALNAAVAIVCAHQVQPRLPIFGLDIDNVLFGVYGVEDELPKNIAATTPGSLHYVACVEEDTKVVGTATHGVGSFYFDPGAPYSLVQIRYERHQYIWLISLRETKTGEEITSTLIEGGEPPPLPSTTQEIYQNARKPLFFGDKPDVEDLADWLLMAIK